MALRRWIGLLALLGVLLHTGLAARHALAMAAANDPRASLHALCATGASSGGKTAPTDPASALSPCPLCVSADAVVAVLPVEGLIEPSRPWSVAVAPIPGPQPPSAATFDHPPPRGPPLRLA